jgi:hypothetical protein
MLETQAFTWFAKVIVFGELMIRWLLPALGTPWRPGCPVARPHEKELPTRRTACGICAPAGGLRSSSTKRSASVNWLVYPAPGEDRERRGGRTCGAFRRPRLRARIGGGPD